MKRAGEGEEMACERSKEYFQGQFDCGMII